MRLRLFCLIFALFAVLTGSVHAESPLLKAITRRQGLWFNTAPLTQQDLQGKVVLVDFWTYSCINCLRTLPYLKAWAQTYKDQGLVVLGVHAPEFDFEKNPDNVAKAVKRFGITYPVVQDNDLALWQAFDNHYWPAHYLIDRNGKLVSSHFGEGGYDETEKEIRALLNAKGAMANIDAVPGQAASQQSPETYLGTARAEHFENKGAAGDSGSYTLPENLGRDSWGLQGKWQRLPEYSVAGEKNAILTMHFRAGKVFLVMGSPAGTPVAATILYNGKPEHLGKDVQAGTVLVKEHRLYELLALPGVEEGTITIQAQAPGLELYAFTFGE